jgi:hypothetical protein
VLFLLLLYFKTSKYRLCSTIPCGREKVSNLLTAYKKNPGALTAQEERKHVQKLYKRLG